MSELWSKNFLRDIEKIQHFERFWRTNLALPKY